MRKSTLIQEIAAERAEAMAFLLLSERSDVRVHKAERRSREQAESRLDYYVEILSEGRGASPRFRVETLALLGALKTRKMPAAARKKTLARIAEDGLTLPVCLFVFTMGDNAGYYLWLTEPTLEDGKPRLRLNGSEELRPLNAETLEGLVSEVNAWYAALSAGLAA